MGADFRAGQTWKQSLSRHFVIAVSVGNIAAYFVTSFLFNFHPQDFEFIIISPTSLIACGVIALGLFDESFDVRPNSATTATLFLASLLSISAIVIALQFPGLFDPRILFMESGRFWFFVFLALIADAALFFVSKRAEIISIIKKTRIVSHARENLLGLYLAVGFFFVYFTFAETINFPNFRTVDLYFDFDISEWLARFSGMSVSEIPVVRAVHPAILLFVRPLVWFVGLFLNGDRLHALFLVHAFTGAACVFMIWLIAKSISNNDFFSLFIASLLGTSASHLLLGSMIETYIYSAFGLILFAFLIQSGRTSLRPAVSVAVLTAGVTVSNLAQTFLLFASSRPPFKRILSFASLTLILVLGLNFIQQRIYSASSSLTSSSSVRWEESYLHQIDFHSWKWLGRVNLTARAVSLYSIVAPAPFILDKELGWEGIPHFRTYKITVGQFHVAGYSGLADLTAKFWFILLLSALGVFVYRFIKSPASHLIPFALLLCIGFNFIFHTLYGDDPMLYSPDWVYALVLFIAYAIHPWADRKWLHFALIVFLGLTMATNLNLIRLIMQVSAPVYGQ